MSFPESKFTRKIDQERSDVEACRKLRELCDAKDIRSDYNRALFTLLFPDDLRIESFDASAVEFSPETKLDKKQHNLRRSLMEMIGYLPREVAKKNYQPQPHDVPEYEVFFTANPHSIVNSLHELPVVQRINYVAQTDPRSSLVKKLEQIPEGRLSRGDHSKHLAKIATYTVFRLAIKQPQEFLAMIEDHETYLKTQLQNTDHHETDQSRLQAFECTSSDEKRLEEILHTAGIAAESIEGKALYKAYAYSKYVVFGAYLHDIATPALGDIFMKTRAESSESSQASVHFSEDTYLAEHIDLYLDNDLFGLKDIIETHGLSKAVLSLFIHDLATESDLHLAGQIMKNKRKGVTIHPKLMNAAYDLDQESGTITNASKWIKSILPNGCRYFSRREKMPIGSFDERLRFFVYALLTEKTQNEVVDILSQAGIAPEEMYIAIEEISLGHNVAIDSLKKEDGTALPVLVVTRPADVKKAISMFVVNQLVYYRASYREPIERAVQTVIASCLQDKAILTERDFIYRTDQETLLDLSLRVPIIPFLLLLANKSQILTKNELEMLPNSENLLVHTANMHGIIPNKNGTLVHDPETKIIHRLDMLGRKRNNHEEKNPLSLPSRLEHIQSFIESSDLYYVISLTDEEKVKLTAMLQNKQFSQASRDAMKHALTFWGVTW